MASLSRFGSAKLPFGERLHLRVVFLPPAPCAGDTKMLNVEYSLPLPLAGSQSTKWLEEKKQNKLFLYIRTFLHRYMNITFSTSKWTKLSFGLTDFAYRWNLI